MRLDQSTPAVVTGGASGLGAATARALTAKGVKVAILDLNAEAEKRSPKSWAASSPPATSPARRVSVPRSRPRAPRHGQERILVNCAGIGIAKRISRRVKGDKHDRAARSCQLH